MSFLRGKINLHKDMKIQNILILIENVQFQKLRMSLNLKPFIKSKIIKNMSLQCGGIRDFTLASSLFSCVKSEYVLNACRS